MNIEKQVELLECKPGDMFVLHSEGYLSATSRDRIGQTWKAFAGEGSPLLIIDGGARLSVMRPAKVDDAATIDDRTGRPVGDHGTAMQAIEFALDKLHVERDTFLNSWRHGDIDEFPEFYEWLNKGEK